MRHLWFEGPGRLGWREAPDPAVADDRDVLVRPLAVARCDLDPAIALGLYPMPAPFAMGHEVVGEVVDAGDAASRWQVGDRVVVPFQISCGRCATCRRGLTNACESVPPGSAFGLGPHGGHDHGGGLADLLLVPFGDESLLALPDGIDPEVACGVPDNVADGYRCVAGPMADWPGEDVLVVGGLAQSVGLYAAACALALGAPRVVFVDHDERRLRLAAAIGAEAVEVPLAEQREADVGRFPVTVDACVLDEGRELALRSTAPCGTCTSVSAGAGARSELPLRRLYLQGIRYEIGRVHARATAPAVLDLVATGRLDPAAVISAVVPWDDAPQAMVADDVKLVFTR